jgi:hypothetical protein
VISSSHASDVGDAIFVHSLDEGMLNFYLVFASFKASNKGPEMQGKRLHSHIQLLAKVSSFRFASSTKYLYFYVLKDSHLQVYTEGRSSRCIL